MSTLNIKIYMNKLVKILMIVELYEMGVMLHQHLMGLLRVKIYQHIHIYIEPQAHPYINIFTSS